ncbi:uncharacterized protein LAJ45_08835 [Morchella importuna]|uniref:uncharacterized protein n=1 Tax=Morchella importuna TaxID=1174673 RepID=UPI001E8D6D79|nr:uncharacterized protein LAJ45_08835 [Morchella importuna]KAH8147036.1 hypothetical protein LAJ45_08835 [Morchella importuna]
MRENMRSTRFGVASEQQHADDQMDVDENHLNNQAVTSEASLNEVAARRIRDDAMNNARNAMAANTMTGNRFPTPASAVPTRMLPRSSEKTAGLEYLLKQADEEPATPFPAVNPISRRDDPDGSPLPASFRASRSGGPRLQLDEHTATPTQYATAHGKKSSPAVVEGSTTPTDGQPQTPTLPKRGIAAFNAIKKAGGERSAELVRRTNGRFTAEQLKWLEDGYRQCTDINKLTQMFNDRHLDDRSIHEINDTLYIIVEFTRGVNKAGPTDA